MIRLACDSNDLGALIATPVIITYADLITSPEVHRDLRSRFPRSRLVFTDRGLGDPQDLATCWDVERGTLIADQVPDRFDKAHARGRQYLTVYCDLDNLAEVEKVMAGRPWWRWVASWGAGLEVPGHPWAMLQFASGAQLGAGVDLSLIHDDTYRPDVLTAPGPAVEAAQYTARVLAGHLAEVGGNMAELLDGLGAAA